MWQVLPWSAALEAPDDMSDAAVEQGLLAALLSALDATPRPARNGGLIGRRAAHRLDTATLIADKWRNVTTTSVFHFWLNFIVLPVAEGRSSHFYDAIRFDRASFNRVTIELLAPGRLHTSRRARPNSGLL